MAIKAVMSIQRVTAEQAKGNASRLLADLDHKDRVVIAAMYSLEVNKALAEAVEFTEDRIISLIDPPVDVEATEVDTEAIDAANIQALSDSTGNALKVKLTCKRLHNGPRGMVILKSSPYPFRVYYY